MTDKARATEAQFEASVRERFPGVMLPFQRSLVQLRFQLPAYPGFERVAAQALRDIDQAFGVHWPESMPDTMHQVMPEIREDMAVPALIAARSQYAGYKDQMYNPQLLAAFAIDRIVRKACEANEVNYEASGLRNTVRAAIQPLVKAPRYHDHEMSL